MSYTANAIQLWDWEKKRTMTDKKLEKQVAKKLLAAAPSEKNWGFLPKGKSVTEEAANKFLFWCAMMRQWKIEPATLKCEKIFSAEFLGNPNNPKNLWDAILATSTDEWDKWWEQEKFHRFRNKLKKAQRKNAEIIVKQYNGDARNIWQDQSQAEIKKRLRDLSGIGPALANMAVGALRDSGQIEVANGDVKPDVHVCRVLSRILRGNDTPFTPETVACITRRMHNDPWQLDYPLLSLGRELCKKSAPNCGECYLKKICKTGVKRLAAKTP